MNLALPRASNEIREPSIRTRRILVIDDDDSIGVAIQTILGRRRYETVLAPRACVGIQALEESAFDAVMIDIFMPGLNGLDTIEHIRRVSPIPIIAMSGFRLRSPESSIDYLDMATRRGATLCMRKPFNSAQLIEAVEWSGGLHGQSEGSTQ
jgi:DNA-binding NtrC family response regulator